MILEVFSNWSGSVVVVMAVQAPGVHPGVEF